jgi:hypothetical protein
MESKRKKILSAGFIILFIGIFLISVPFPNSENIFKRENSTIYEGNFYIAHVYYPWRSFNQLININIIASNGTFTLLILNETNLSKWIINSTFEPTFQAENSTEINNSVLINPEYYGELSCIIIAVSQLIYSANIELEYYNYFTSWGGLLVVIGLILVMYLFVLNWKQKRKLIKIQ